MTRRLFTLFSAASLALCVATVALWMRSYDRADQLHGRLWGDQSFLIASKQGRLFAVAFAANWWTWGVRSHGVDDVLSFPVGDADQYTNRLGFGHVDRPTYFVMDPMQETPEWPAMIFGAATARLNGSGIVVPMWLPVLLLAALPAASVAGRLRRGRRESFGRCAGCGYDLRATPEQGRALLARCPECGTVTGEHAIAT